MKSISKVVILLFFTSLFGCGESSPEPPTTLLFPDTERIELVSPSNATTVGTSFNYSVPDDVEFIVLAIFQPAPDPDGQDISNKNALQCGSNTGLDGFGRGTVTSAKLYQADPITHEFDESSPCIISGNYYWTVWGFKGIVLTHSSPVWSVNFP
jgi:hypothetical protein